MNFDEFINKLKASIEDEIILTPHAKELLIRDMNEIVEEYKVGDALVENSEVNSSPTKLMTRNTRDSSRSLLGTKRGDNHSPKLEQDAPSDNDEIKKEIDKDYE